MSRKPFDRNQKRELLTYARDVIEEFEKGVILKGDPNPHDWGGNGMVYFFPYAARFTDEFLNARRKFTVLASRMLKARIAHEKTIMNMCKMAGQEYVKRNGEAKGVVYSIENAAKELVDKVLSQAGKEYKYLSPNFVVRHSDDRIIRLGRVQSMRTVIAKDNTFLSSQDKVILTVENSLGHSFNEDGTAELNMPGSVWVVEVPAAKANVPEEAKWLVDVAVSLMRLVYRGWKSHFPRIGELEFHPIHPTEFALPQITLDGEAVHVTGWTLPGWYEVDADVATAMNDAENQSKGDIIFDPPDHSLAQRVAQGLGWMSRGRQSADRSERLLYFFTALESLLTSSNVNDPVTQTISRYASIIYVQEVKSRIVVYNQIRNLYALRSSVVHGGRREVLWQDVNALQTYVETVFWLVLHRCDLSMRQEAFEQSLRDASHGLRWEFAAPSEES